MLEYSLAGALLIMASLGALVFLGGNLNGLFGGMLKSPAIPAVVAAGKSGSAPAAGSPPVSTENSSGQMGSTGFSKEASVIYTGRYPENMIDTVQTVGANGATDQLANIIRETGARLLAEGKITPAQASLLDTLANRGHSIANVQKAVEDGFALAAATGKSPLEVKVSAEGQSDWVPYLLDAMLNESNGSAGTPQDVLAHIVGGHSILDSTDGELGTSGPVMDAFHLAYIEARDNGALYDPAAKAIVDDAVIQIFGINASLLNNAAAIAPEAMREKMASSLTHAESAIICDTGNGKDTGTLCN